MSKVYWQKCYKTKYYQKKTKFHFQLCYWHKFVGFSSKTYMLWSFTINVLVAFRNTKSDSILLPILALFGRINRLPWLKTLSTGAEVAGAQNVKSLCSSLWRMLNFISRCTAFHLSTVEVMDCWRTKSKYDMTIFATETWVGAELTLLLRSRW